MPQVRVREKHQITLPAAVVRAANIGLHDTLEVSYQDGVIILMTPQAVQKRRPLMAMAGSTKGLYGRSTEERQQYLADERQSWHR